MSFGHESLMNSQNFNNCVKIGQFGIQQNGFQINKDLSSFAKGNLSVGNTQVHIKDCVTETTTTNK